MMMSKWVWKVAPVSVVILVWIVKAWRVQTLGLGSLLLYGLFVAGWVLGWILSDLEKYPLQNWIKGWKVDRERPAVRNVLTVTILTVMGVWLLTSSAGAIAWGLIWGLGIRLWSEFWVDPGYKKWYWVFAREFSSNENKIFVYSWTGLLVLQGVILLAK